jgi:hypothetical protein
MLTAIGIKKKCKRIAILFIEPEIKQAACLIKRLQNYLYFRAPKVSRCFSGSMDNHRKIKKISGKY